MRYYEDFAVGDSWTFGPHEMTEAEMVEFAERYDPQPMHVDPAAARETRYGGLIASGWHTIAVAMRLLVDGLVSDTAGVASPGVDAIRWTHPVRPGDELSVELEVNAKRVSESDPAVGIIDWTWEITTREAVAATLESSHIVERREE